MTNIKFNNFQGKSTNTLSYALIERKKIVMHRLLIRHRNKSYDYGNNNNNQKSKIQ